jgi:hypothetical protein
MPSSEKAVAEARLKAFIGKFEPQNQALIRALRREMRKRMPTAIEMVYDNYNFFVIGYSPTEKPSDAVFSIAAQAKGVSLVFTQGARLADPDKLLSGSGNQVRSMRVEAARDLNRLQVRRLMAAAIADAVPMPSSGRGKLVIRSVSKKQRPRRPA